MNGRTGLKRWLARVPDNASARGASILIYHRIGGDSGDEMDTPSGQFAEQLDALAGHDVLALDDALDRLERGDERPSIVLTFDDGFADVYANAWPLLRERDMPFTVYVAGGLIGGRMRWEGSIGSSQGAPAVTWEELAEMQDSGLCTVGNHTFSHAPPDVVDETELDRCSDEIHARLGDPPRHFAWTWGVEVPALRPAIERRFRSAVTGSLGRNEPGHDPLCLARIPVRRTDPLPFFVAKLRGRLVAERTYARVVSIVKRSRVAT